MIVVQRVRVRWGARSRGAPAANLRRGLPERYPLPSTLPDADLVLHDVVADEAAGYEPSAQVAVGAEAAARAWLRVTPVDHGIEVRRQPGWDAYPRRQYPARLFTLLPGQVGRYRANFRFVGCQSAPRGHYEQWTVHVAHGVDEFAAARVDHDVDHRVRLYGGRG